MVFELWKVGALLSGSFDMVAGGFLAYRLASHKFLSGRDSVDKKGIKGKVDSSDNTILSLYIMSIWHRTINT